jgi:glycosyltransferase involved in cell wall biosynthesis
MDIKAEFIPTNTLQNAHFNSFIFRGFQENPVILFCGRVVKEKGIEELIYAISSLKKAGKIYSLHIVGPISKSYKIYLEHIIEKEGLNKVVYFKGFVKFGNELLSVYRSSDIYVLPSYHEGFPHSIWEAASTSTPIITTKVGGIPGLVSDNEVFFTEVKSAESLKKAIEFVYCNPKITNLKALGAYNLAKSHSIESCINILIQKIQNQISISHEI